MTEEQKFIRAFGANINKHRKRLKLSFGKFAALCDIEKTTAYKLAEESGHNITIGTLYKISKGLNIPLKDLVEP